MGKDVCKTIGSIIYKCQVEELKIESCDLSTDKIEGLLEGGLADSKVKFI